jgi:solute carrier family 1 (high affinity glutamate transporter) protein 1
VIDYYYPVPGDRSGLNVLGLVMFCLIFGFIISKLDKKHSALLIDFVEAINEASVKGIGMLML